MKWRLRTPVSRAFAPRITRGFHSLRTFKILLLLAIVIALTVTGSGFWLATRPLGMSTERVSFTVPAGSGLRSAAHVIEKSGIELPAWQLSWLGRLLDRSTQIKAGSYEIARGINALGVLDMLTRGDVTRAEIVLVEGKTFRQWRALLDQHPELRHDTAGLSDTEVLKRLGAGESHPEGLFFPDTYLFDKGASDLDVLRRAYRAMQQRLETAWTMRDAGLAVKTPYELLTLASIVEKETGLPSDRSAVASVFANRLRIRMPLQTDPTVIYGLGERFDGNLRKVDLQTDTPWNTYTRSGLPPTPISMPGQASLDAASRPPRTGHLYFVARGDGSSQFSSTLDEHNRAVNRYQRGGRS